MPEGHILARQAEWFNELVGLPVHVTAMQGGAFAAQLNGGISTTFRSAAAHGKHLFLRLGNGMVVNIHLGMYGSFDWHEPSPLTEPDPTPPKPVRMRVEYPTGWVDLRSPARCRVISLAEEIQLRSTLGVDPLDLTVSAEVGASALAEQTTEVGYAIMDQYVVAGVGNIIRAECLFRTRLDPFVPACEVPIDRLTALYEDARLVLRESTDAYAIRTVLPEHTPSVKHGWRDSYYVYRRRGLPCWVCGTAVRYQRFYDRGLYWCKTCQRNPSE